MPSYDPETNDAKYVRPYDVTGTCVTELLGVYWWIVTGGAKNTAADSAPYPVVVSVAYAGVHVRVYDTERWCVVVYPPPYPVNGTGVYPDVHAVEHGA